MKIFRDLIINLNGYDVDHFIEQITASCGENWQRALEHENNSKYFNEKKIFCFEYLKKGLPYAELVLIEKEKNCLYVSNILPIEIGELSINEYNNLLIDFKTNVIDTINDTKIVSETTKDELLLKDVIGEEAADLLKQFSRLANKSTGNIHPSDKKMWFNFVSKAHKFLHDKEYNDGDLTDIIENSLKEQGWSKKWADDLACQFQLSYELLEFKENDFA